MTPVWFLIPFGSGAVPVPRNVTRSSPSDSACAISFSIRSVADGIDVLEQFLGHPD